jgi:hypothetical protein
MRHRREGDFAAVRWQSMPPDGSDREVVRRAIERGRQLRSEAIRRGGRATFDALRRGFFRAATFLRCAALGLAGRPQAADCWRGSPRRA